MRRYKYSHTFKKVSTLWSDTVIRIYEPINFATKMRRKDNFSNENNYK